MVVGIVSMILEELYLFLRKNKENIGGHLENKILKNYWRKKNIAIASFTVRYWEPLAMLLGYLHSWTSIFILYTS
jgi:hypothetical protein